MISKTRYAATGEPYNNRRVKAHVGDHIVFTELNCYRIPKDQIGQVIRMTHSTKTGWHRGLLHAWYYKVDFKDLGQKWIMASSYWKVI